MNPKPRREVTLLAAAKSDIGRLNDEDPAVAKLALRMLRDLREGSITGVPLSEMSKSGDLTDCRKLYFGTGSPPSHRIVYRCVDGDPAQIEVVEVIAVESRDDMYVYLLASIRLGRLPTETKTHFNRLHQDVIARRSAKKPKK